MAALAITYDGTKTTDVDLNDGGVWVTYLNMDGGRSVAAHLNYPSRTLDSFTESTDGDFDVSQSGNHVALHELDSNAVASVNTATWVAGSRAGLPKSGAASQGGDVLAVTDPDQGKVWAVPADAAEQFSPEITPVLRKAAGVRAVVGVDGVIHTVTPDGTLRNLHRDGRAFTVEKAGEVPKHGPGDDVVLTAVGGTGVVFDRTAGWVAWPGHEQKVSGAEDIQLQQPGTDADVVALAAPNGLLEVPLGGGDVRTLDVRTGEPIAPVSVHGCLYAAWAGSAEYRRDCDGTSDDVAKTYPTQLANRESKSLVFRVNRDVVVLNDTSDGDILLPDDDMKIVSDWAAIKAALNPQKSNPKDPNPARPPKSDRNRPPKAKDDTLGVRAGQTVALPVLANDTDPDGDVLTASVGKGDTALGKVEPVRDGRALRITVPADAHGATSFSYTVADGNGGKDTGEVTLSVHTPNQDVPPAQIPGRTSELTMVQLKSARHHILPEWYDPDGDPYWIDHVVYPKGLSGTFRPDGTVDVTDDGTQEPGRRTVDVYLSDGRGGVAKAPLRVTVKPKGTKLPPTVNADYVQVQVGEQARLSPLTNDTDPNDDALFVTGVGAFKGGTARADSASGTITFKGVKAGTYYPEYSVSDGTSVVQGRIRVDVIPPPSTAAVPIPDDDIAVIPSSGETTVDVLNNDVDPLGGVLVLQSVSQADGVSASVVDHAMLRVQNTSLGERTVTLKYTVANKNGVASGTVTVVADQTPEDESPTAVGDNAVVRSGDVVTVDVLDNDVSPGDRELTVDPNLVVVSGADLGTAFVSENKVRFKADADGGTARFTYTATDPEGRFSSAYVTVSITPKDGVNSAPVPEPGTMRVNQGGSTDLQVNLDGIDPEGDSVSIVGLKNAPRQGVVSIDGPTITYTASGDAGTDTFSYLVEDRFGARAEGQVQVGVAARPATNERPITVLDAVTVQPGRMVSVPVLVNDVDPEGEPLGLVRGSVKPYRHHTDAGAVVRHGRVLLTTPDDEGVLRFTYVATDGSGESGQTEGLLTVTVSKDAPQLPPTARDDVVPVNRIVGQQHVDVDVLENDDDPDGAAEALTPSSKESGAEVLDNGKLRVPVKADRQVILYQVTDADGLTGNAVVVVPGAKSAAALRPVVKPDADLPIVVKAGTPRKVDVADYLAVPAGKQVSVPFSENIQVGPGLADDGLLQGGKTLVLKPRAEFYGMTAITFLASDHGSAADAHTTIITLPVKVESNGKTPPTLVLPTLEIARGEDRKVTLSGYAEDPDPGDQEKLSFALVDNASGLDASVDGDTLKLSVPGTAKLGVSLPLTVSVSDGTHTTQAHTRAIVVSSTKPLMQVRPGVKEAQAGKPLTLDLDDYVTNPYASDGKPIHVVGQPKVSGGQASVKTDTKTKIVVTPAADYHGTLRLTYVVADASDAPDRRKQGEVRIIVSGKPAPPTAVVALAVESQTVDVTWKPGADNGKPITGFTIRWQSTEGDKGSVKVGKVAARTVTGLINDHHYKFQVIATNEVGDSLPSGWSREARPDAVPPAPNAPHLEFGDKMLRVSWNAVRPNGSPVKQYEIFYNGMIVGTGSPGTTKDLAALTNGTSYQVKVRALNDADANDGAGPWSAVTIEHPSGDPQAPTGVKAVGDPPDANPSALISWDLIGGEAANGDPVTRYEVKRTDSGATVACAPVDDNSCRVALAAGDRATFQVRGFNRANPVTGVDGWSGWSAPTQQIAGANPPGQVPGVSARATGVSGQAQITHGNAPDGGAEQVEYWYRIGNGGAQQLPGNGVVDGFTDGVDRSVTVWAVGYANGQSAAGPESTYNGVNSFSPCTGSVTAIQSNYDSVTFNYVVVAHGRPCDFNRAGGGAPSGSTGGTVNSNVDIGGGTNNAVVTLQLNIRTRTSGNDASVGDANPSDSGRTWSPTIDWGDGGTGCSLFNNCHWASLTVNHFRPNSTVYCWMGGVNAPDWSATYGVDGNGYRFVQHTWQYNGAGPYFPNDYDGTSCRQN